METTCCHRLQERHRVVLSRLGQLEPAVPLLRICANGSPVEPAMVARGCSLTYFSGSFHVSLSARVLSGRMTERVLVADDDRALREAVGRALRLVGYEVDLAEDGAQVVESLGSLRPDIVVLDVLMAVLAGLSVCRFIAEKGAGPPVLLLTARHAVSDRVLGLDAGADDYLTKPFALEELLARIRALLRRKYPG